ncbi:Na/Pi symporter [Candidatus Gracilibacteria bacterium]|nr:Na/Pi symporter [Candidatus Gracilibacteria bacterium]NJM87507.1 Na/Pi symporter [Hydrococcus sp. RU_2_2]
MENATTDRATPNKTPAYIWIGIIALVYLLIVAVGIISYGFKLAAGDRATELFQFATNPLAGLIVGTLTTALIQSSSTVTSIIVGLVAGGLPVTIAVPMVMGANIGTTITNTVVSLGHIRNAEEFRSAFAAATIHDFFNLTCVLIFLPLEITTHFLEKIASFFSNLLFSNTFIGFNGFDFIQAAILPIINLLKLVTHSFLPPFDGIAFITIGVILIFVSILYIGKLLKLAIVGQAKTLLRSAIGRGSLMGIFSGMLVTMLVQSSSTTTSLIVPLAGTGLLTLEEVYPFTLGANIGTCITALIAATAVLNNHLAAMQIAMVHLFFNVSGVTLIYGTPFLRQLPILAAQTLAKVASDRKYLAFVYIISVFFLIPVILLELTSMRSQMIDF